MYKTKMPSVNLNVLTVAKFAIVCYFSSQKIYRRRKNPPNLQTH